MWVDLHGGERNPAGIIEIRISNHDPTIYRPPAEDDDVLSSSCIKFDVADQCVGIAGTRPAAGLGN